MYFNILLIPLFFSESLLSISSYLLIPLSCSLIVHRPRLSKLSELAGLIVISSDPGWWLLSELPALLILRTYVLTILTVYHL